MAYTGLRGRVALVTGANNPHGIGAAIARSLAREGVSVGIHYYRTHAPSEAPAETFGEAFYNAQQSNDASVLVEEIRGMGVACTAVEADLSKPESIPHILESVERELGAVEILVNNACYWEADTFLPPQSETEAKHVELWTGRPQTFRPDVFDRLFSADTRAVAHLIAEFANRHIQRGAIWGRILSISTDGAHCFPSEVTYGAAKIAVEGYSRSAAVELGRYGITVNVISPGPIQTGWITSELEQMILEKQPIRRVGQPQDIANAALFLTSDQAEWITGQVLHVGGGNHV